MQIFVVLIIFHLAVVIMSMPALVRHRHGWAYSAGVAALVSLSLAPVFSAFFVVSGVPYFNRHVPVAVLAGLLYVASFLASVISVVIYSRQARRPACRPEQ
ncbi:hypothetical protein [Stenotrophomonas maltophilia]|uniref:hypothetical protein n=1 Tax=Stenotrophomonas maltophilia TaxID=40324 RepID=UPI00128DD994|nr:hypothetical protein [Stenotrophomonas maltophilia]